MFTSTELVRELVSLKWKIDINQNYKRLKPRNKKNRENRENVPSIEVVEVFLVQCNLLDIQYQHVLYTFTPSKSHVYSRNVDSIAYAHLLMLIWTLFLFVSVFENSQRQVWWN